MPTWGGILKELHKAQEEPGEGSAWDRVRRKYLIQMAEKTKRPVILYATRFLQGSLPIDPNLLSITDEDIQGLMEVVHELEGPSLDLILHSPGGSLEAAAAFVSYLRSKYDDIRVVVPMMAMSAACMIACCSNKILMGKHSFLGPIDPQLVLSTSLGVRMVPAQAILDQFDLALLQCKQDKNALAAWAPMLSQYGPDLLVQCQNASQRSEHLVCKWLQENMFQEEADAKKKSKHIAEWLSDHKQHKSHSRHITRDELITEGLFIERLEDDQELQDIVLSVYHAVTHTFSMTNTIKIIENNKGRAFVKSAIPPPPKTSSPSINPQRNIPV